MRSTELREASGLEVGLWQKSGMMLKVFAPSIRAGAVQGSVYTDFRGKRSARHRGRRSPRWSTPESPQAAALTSGETHRGCRGLTGHADMKELKEFWEENASGLSHVPSLPFPAPVMPTRLCGPRADHLTWRTRGAGAWPCRTSAAPSPAHPHPHARKQEG